MRALTNTNIIVDDFDYCKGYPKGTFIHFLSHYHADHYKGMSPNWDYGPVYCSEITKNLILANYPNIPDIRTFGLNEKFEVALKEDGSKIIHATFFNANHIPGSVMILFEGYMGTILHTGDMRWSDSMLTDNTVLYPIEKRNKFNKNCSIHVDELIFDNTYMNPVHKFPPRDKAIGMVIDIIEKNRGKHVIIAMGILGKERVALEVSRHFQTQLLIPNRKYNMMKAMGLPVEMMMTNWNNDGENHWIEVIHKREREERLEQEYKKGNRNFIMITIEFTGFQVSKLIAPDGINYLVAYSQHSNYGELEKFVKSICPSILRKLVLPYLEKPQFKFKNINNLRPYYGYINGLKRGGKSAFTYFIKNYTDITELSDNYKRWMTPEAQKLLMDELKIPITINKGLRRVRNKKKKALEEKLQAYTKENVDVEALRDKIFHASRYKRKSFAQNTLHKMAINSSQNLNVMFSKMGAKVQLKKGKVNKFMQERIDKIKEENDRKKEERIWEKLRNAASLSQFNTQPIINCNFHKDDELLSLMEKFIQKSG